MSEAKAPSAEDFPLRINVENCGDCVFCVSVCPFEALSRDEATKRVRLDREKCRLCGLCYTACPSKLVSIAYYDTDALAGKLRGLLEKGGSKTLVMSCRGSEPGRATVVSELGTGDFIEFTLPCVGRVALPFFLSAAETGIEKIAVFACEDDFCRFKKGSTSLVNTVNTANALLGDMGFSSDMVSFKKGSRRVIPDSQSKCICCGNCVAKCPYQGIKLDGGAAKFDLALCKGCGVCVSECPVTCLELQGSETAEASRQIAEFAASPGGPKALAFVCMWSEFSALDIPGALPDLKILPLPCAGRLELVHILEALEQGIDGVLVVTCPEDECKQEKRGTQHASLYEAKLETILGRIGLSGRVSMATATPKRMGEFANLLGCFIEGVKKNGHREPTGPQLETLAVMKDVLRDVRMRWLLAKEREMLEAGNVYGEKVPLEKWNRVFDDALADRYVQHSILRLARRSPMNAGEIGRLLGLAPRVVLRHLVELKRQNLVEMVHGHGDQKFTAKGVGK
jgi:coenzyme F420-reducing hydrogenase delta subunit/Pyruvate/2-oxoacid:ferredoxin oxidoreductase delta subunit/DNA-binding transcriptional ArsR family regulator